MATRTDQIRERKTAAKNQRDRGVKGYPRALTMLQEAIAIARAELNESSVPQHRALMAAELSDCFGLIGGVQRRWADETTGAERSSHLKASIRAYDEGFAYEADPQYGIVNTYNRVNRLVVRVLLAPEALTAASTVAIDPDITPLNLVTELDSAAAAIREQITGPRRGDYWALADLALLEVLLGNRPAALAYADFIALSPPDFAYASALAALRPLADLPLPTAPALKEAVALLASRLQGLRA
jgi:hypothetical protein